jgi:hypothetical protein
MELKVDRSRGMAVATLAIPHENAIRFTRLRGDTQLRNTLESGE